MKSLREPAATDLQGITDIIPFGEGGELNKNLVRNFMFYGDADTESRWGGEFILLSNQDRSKKAGLGIDFAQSVDMGDHKLSFYAKGEAGGEQVRISLRDSQNSYCHSKIYTIENFWQRFVVDVSRVGDHIDSENIAHVDFEINPEEKQILSRSRMYLKGIGLIKEGG